MAVPEDFGNDTDLDEDMPYWVTVHYPQPFITMDDLRALLLSWYLGSIRPQDNSEYRIIAIKPRIASPATNEDLETLQPPYPHDDNVIDAEAVDLTDAREEQHDSVFADVSADDVSIDPVLEETSAMEEDHLLPQPMNENVLIEETPIDEVPFSTQAINDGETGMQNTSTTESMFDDNMHTGIYGGASGEHVMPNAYRSSKDIIEQVALRGRTGRELSPQELETLTTAALLFEYNLAKTEATHHRSSGLQKTLHFMKENAAAIVPLGLLIGGMAAEGGMTAAFVKDLAAQFGSMAWLLLPVGTVTALWTAMREGSRKFVGNTLMGVFSVGSAWIASDGSKFESHFGGMLPDGIVNATVHEKQEALAQAQAHIDGIKTDMQNNHNMAYEEKNGVEISRLANGYSGDDKQAQQGLKGLAQDQVNMAEAMAAQAQAQSELNEAISNSPAKYLEHGLAAGFMSAVFMSIYKAVETGFASTFKHFKQAGERRNEERSRQRLAAFLEQPGTAGDAATKLEMKKVLNHLINVYLQNLHIFANTGDEAKMKARVDFYNRQKAVLKHNYNEILAEAVGDFRTAIGAQPATATVSGAPVPPAAPTPPDGNGPRDGFDEIRDDLTGPRRMASMASANTDSEVLTVVPLMSVLDQFKQHVPDVTDPRDAVRQLPVAFRMTPEAVRRTTRRFTAANDWAAKRYG
ncbi:MAG: hypothetical protein KGI97_01275 [Alphaproteobacteria bacterium]|nr:hypothetical protein [Alphaproteobacteria bacterium]